MEVDRLGDTESEADADGRGGARVLPRSNTRPVLTALGAATVITLGAVAVPATAFAADPSPTASEDPTPDPPSTPPTTPPTTPPSTPPTSAPPTSTPPSTPPSKPPPVTKPPYTPPPKTSSLGASQPSLSIALSLSASTVAPGGSVTARVTLSARHAVAHHAVLRISAPSASVSGPGSLGDLGAKRSESAVLKIPAGHDAGTITVTASLSADHAGPRSTSRTLTVARDTAAASAASGTTGLPGLPSGLSLPNVSGATTTALGGPAQARLPLVAGEQPAVAPGAPQNVEDVSLRSATTPLGLDATTYRLLWTQVAWLAALLVGISLLLTQLRLKRRLPSRPARRSR